MPLSCRPWSLLLAAAMIAAPEPACGLGPAQPLERGVKDVDPAAAGIGREVANLQMRTLDGSIVTIDQLLAGKQATVIAMTSTGCPVSRRYAPRLAGLEKAWAGKVAFAFVNTVDGETPEQMREVIRDFGLRGPYALDADLALRREMKPGTTSEVFVLDAHRVLVYRGAIDDQHKVGGSAAAPRHNYLQDAIEAVVAGRSPAVRATLAPGCLVDMPEIAATKESPAYYPTVARIIAASCVECHRNGGVAPFSLATPAAIQGRAAMIEAVVWEGIMPPNHGVDSKRSVGVRDGALRDDDRDALIAWLNSSRAIGDASVMEPAPASSGGWAIGQPDAVLATPPLALPVEGPPLHGRYVVPVNLEGDRWTIAAECRPVMRDSVDAALVWLVRPGEPLPGAEAWPGSAELLASYSPADSVVRLPEETGRSIPAGSILLVDVYASPMGRPLASQLRIGLRLAGTPPVRTARSMVIAAESGTIPAETSHTELTASTVLQSPVRLLSFLPFMRSRGREFVAEAILPDGSRQLLLTLAHYDPRWIIRYPLDRPLDFPAGTRINLRGVFDNSAANHASIDHTRAANIGPGVDDESLMLDIEWESP